MSSTTWGRLRSLELGASDPYWIKSLGSPKELGTSCTKLPKSIGYKVKHTFLICYQFMSSCFLVANHNLDNKTIILESDKMYIHSTIRTLLIWPQAMNLIPPMNNTEFEHEKKGRKSGFGVTFVRRWGHFRRFWAVALANVKLVKNQDRENVNLTKNLARVCCVPLRERC